MKKVLAFYYLDQYNCTVHNKGGLMKGNTTNHAKKYETLEQFREKEKLRLKDYRSKKKVEKELKEQKEVI